MPQPNTFTLLASAARTTTQTLADQENKDAHRFLRVVLDVTSAGTGSITLQIDVRTPSGIYKTLLTGAAVTTNSTNVYEIGPGLPATANVSANTFLGAVWRVKVTANNANSVTYSVEAVTMP